MSGSKKVLVYHHRPKGEPVVANGLDVITKEYLDEILSKHSDSLQCSTKELQAGASHVDIFQRNLLTPEQETEYEAKPNRDSNVASVKLPTKVKMANFLSAKEYSELVILSEKRRNPNEY